MLINETTNVSYPKTIKIRNTMGGMIWQVYHVYNLREAEGLAKNATRMGFESVTLEDYDPEYEETFPGWRETADESVIPAVQRVGEKLIDDAYRWANPSAGVRERASIELALWCAKEVAVGAGATDNADHWGEICQYLEDKLKLMNPKQSSVSDDTNNIS